LISDHHNFNKNNRPENVFNIKAESVTRDKITQLNSTQLNSTIF